MIGSINKILNNALDKLGYESNARVVKSKRPDLCDFQFDGVFALAKANSTSPIEIGNKIVEEINSIEDFSDYFNEVTFAAPGFVNIKVSDSLLIKELSDMESNEKFNIDQVNPETFVLDYGGPNIAKPLHVGHLRTAIVGESVKRILEFVGNKTIADVHLGDFGLQIGQVIYGLDKEGKTEFTLEDLNRIYPAMSALCKEDESVKDACALITKELQDGNEEYYRIFENIRELSKTDIKRIYDYLDVNFDYWLGEMDSREYILPVEKILSDKGLLESSQGALVVDVKDESDSKEIPPLIFKKSNGAYLYGSTDMATIYQRELDFKPDNILYVTDLRQAMHFKQVFRASTKSGITDANLEHLGYGTINGLDGKPYKTRSGNTPSLDNLFKDVKEIFISKKVENKDMSDVDVDKIVNAILKFADLQNSREKDYIFDINKFSNTTGKTGPYILYTYLRINKIIEDEEYITPKTVYNKYDRDLMMKITELSNAVYLAYNERKPSYIAEYVYDLCVTINSFYQNNHIKGLEDEEMKQSWVYTLTLANRILKAMLELLIIDIPSEM